MTLRFSLPTATRAFLLGLGLLLLATGCGGGGGGAASPPPPPDSPKPTVVLVEIVDNDPDEVLDTIEDVVEDTGATYLGQVDGTTFHRFELPASLSPEAFFALVDDDVRITDREEDVDLSSPEGGGATIPLGGELFASAVAQQPELMRIGLAAAHTRVTGAGVRVAVLDTGIDPDHPLLVGHVGPGGHDFLDGDDDPRYEPNGRIFLHRHRSDTHTLVLRGEHRLYEPDGSLKEVRPVGCYTAAPADAPPHSEGGGAEGALVLYSTRGGAEGVLFDVLDEAGQVVATLDLADVAGLFEAQGRQPGG